MALRPNPARRAALLLALSLGLAACSGAAPTAGGPVASGEDDRVTRTAEADHEPHTGRDAPPVDAPDADPSAAVDISMVDIAFEPARLELDAGEPVTLTVSNDGQIEHDFDLPAADLHVHGQPGDEETTTLQLDEPGTYEARCTIPGHAAAGMVMDVVVR